jgi:hypothetical protein
MIITVQELTEIDFFCSYESKNRVIVFATPRTIFILFPSYTFVKKKKKKKKKKNNNNNNKQTKKKTHLYFSGRDPVT